MTVMTEQYSWAGFLLSLDLLDGYADSDKIRILYALSNRAERHYKAYAIPKKNGGKRIIQEPDPLLKHVQRNILHHILDGKKVSSYAMAYRKGVSLVDNASPHAGKEKKILKLDIEDFFGSISFYDVYRTCFPEEYFPKPAGMLLSYLCTLDDSLPQGAPTSPCISNIVMKDFDEEGGEWCGVRGITYTRYSDDMTFSWNAHTVKENSHTPSEIIALVRLLLKQKGMNLNDKKTCVIGNAHSQRVTGLVTNVRQQVSRAVRDGIRQEMYYIEKYGVAGHMARVCRVSKSVDTCKEDLERQISAESQIRYLQSLLGRVQFVLQADLGNERFRGYAQSLRTMIGSVQRRA
jgi:hypothetical protein